MKPDPVAAQAYLYGFPLLLMDAAARRGTGSAGAVLNRFTHCFDLAETSLGGVVLPSRDLASSVAWLDLRRAPVILTSLPTNSYYVMSLINAWSNVFATLGTRAAGNAENRFRHRRPKLDRFYPVKLYARLRSDEPCVYRRANVRGRALCPRNPWLASLDERYRRQNHEGSESPRPRAPRAVSGASTRLAQRWCSPASRLMIEPFGRPLRRSKAVDALDALRGHEAAQRRRMPLRKRAGKSMRSPTPSRADGRLTQAPAATEPIICGARAARDIISCKPGA